MNRQTMQTLLGVIRVARKATPVVTVLRTLDFFLTPSTVLKNG